MNDATVVVLAAGIGKRYWPIDTSKSLMRYMGQTLLEHNLHKLQKAGFTKIILIAQEKDLTQIKNLHLDGLTISYVVQHQASGMADALLSAKDEITGPVLVMNAEDVVDQSLYQKLAEHLDDAIHIVGKKVDTYLDVGYLQLEGERVTGIVEKPGVGNEPSMYVNLVFHYFPQISEFVSELTQASSIKDDVYERALTSLIAKKGAHAILYDGIWQPTKYPWHVIDVMNIFLSELKEFRGQNVVIKPNVIIEGPVYIGNNVKIFEHTKIVGPVYIGDNTIVGNNNIIRDSYLGADCVTGFSTDITRSYIGDGCWFHSNYVGDSVLEGNISMGSGAVLANLRLDDGDIGSVIRDQKISARRNKLGAIIGAGVRIGVNASIMPGIKIGKGSFVSSGVVLTQDVPDGQFCAMKSQYEMFPNNQKATTTSRESFKKHL